MTAEIVILAVETGTRTYVSNSLSATIRSLEFSPAVRSGDLVLEVALERLAELVVDARARRYLVRDRPRTRSAHRRPRS